jgi:hypothetical protein
VDFERLIMLRTRFLSVPLAALCMVAGAAHADAITDANANAVAVAVAACIVPGENPLHESRLYAMVHLAAHDAVNAIHRQSRPYAFSPQVQPGASPEAAVATAVRDVLVSQLPLAGVSPECVSAGTARAESDQAKALAAIPEGRARAEGMALGKRAAAAIIALRVRDGSDTAMVDPKFEQGTLPGQWRFTPGSPPIAFAAGWGGVKPFVLRAASQFEPGKPFAIACDRAVDQAGCSRYARDVEEIRRLGSDGVSARSVRTQDQTEIALFWLESSPTAWNRIARTVSESEHLDLWQNARLFALLNAAEADGYVASWATKYHYRFWRPITAIREAANDNNPGTHADPAWMSLRPTPPVPDYESGHALQGAAAAEVMKSVFGRDNIAFDACSLSLPAGKCGEANPVRRHFAGFEQAALENGESRILVGFHFRDAVETDLVHGRQVAQWAVGHHLQPIAGSTLAERRK